MLKIFPGAVVDVSVGLKVDIPTDDWGGVGIGRDMVEFMFMVVDGEGFAWL